MTGHVTSSFADLSFFFFSRVANSFLVEKKKLPTFEDLSCNFFLEIIMPRLFDFRAIVVGKDDEENSLFCTLSTDEFYFPSSILELFRAEAT